jgi:hypothetical protein
MSSLTSISASPIEQLPGQIRKLVDVGHGTKHAKNTPKVTGFLGSHKKPIPISDAEAAYILHQIQEGMSGRRLVDASRHNPLPKRAHPGQAHLNRLALAKRLRRATTSSCSMKRTCAGFWRSMPPTMMRRGRIDL